MEKVYDYLIIGAGPAGLQLGYFLQKNNYEYLILEKTNSPGSFFKKFPKHNILISINKVYTGVDDPDVNFRWDWNSLITDNYDFLFKDYSHEYFPKKRKMVQYLSEFADKNRLSIQYKSQVKNIKKQNEIFVITLKNKEIYKAKVLIVATGVGLPFIPNIPGIEYTEQYVNLLMSKKRFRNKRVLIIGKGNSGFETADWLIDTASVIHLASPSPLNFAWKSHYVGHLRAINNNVLDTYQLKIQNGIINANIKKIDFHNNKYKVTFAYKFADHEIETIEYDHVISCTGFKFDASIFDKSCMPELSIHNRFPKQTSWYESTNIKNLFFAGTLMQERDFKKEQSGFIHGFRFNVRFLFYYLESFYNHKKISSKSLSYNTATITDHTIYRINKTSALWQQTGYLGDLLVCDESASQCHYYNSMPVDFIADSSLVKDHHYFVITLEFGQERIDSLPDVFRVPRVHKHDYEHANLSTFIHPIIRHYFKGQLLSEHHVIEDFEGVWKEPEHIDPLRQYFADELKAVKSKTQINEDK